MQTFHWDQNFVTGLASVDEQHHQLVNLINSLGESLIAGPGVDDSALQVLFGKLANYARFHFNEEESLMRQVGIAPQHLELHHASHQKFIAQVSTIWNSRKSMANPAEVLHGFLTSWLSFHILGEDQAMARQIDRIRHGVSAAEAYANAAAPTDQATAALLHALRNLYHVLSEQNHDLAAANALLEERVAERTKEWEQVNQHLKNISRIDGLLEIANRGHFNERLTEEWRRAVREQQSLGLLMIDVDYFKRFNDTYGHQAGDRCLQAIAQAAKSALHRPGDLLARYGGEELVIMLPNTELEGAKLIALNVLSKIEALQIPHSESDAAPYVTVSIGCAALVPERLSNPNQLISAADHLLYSAKASGRNRVCHNANAPDCVNS
jgi:diguanylate cyclase (GGDEF)-like protein/hemerythrin-like metal-binding protein